MYILNPQNLSNIRTFTKDVSDWLVDNKIPILSICGEYYIFANTKALNLALKRLPLNLKGGEIIE